MKTIAYYLGYLLLPLLFLINLGGNLYRAIKHSFRNAVIQTQGDLHSHKRYYKKA
jgi:hypothetical protein